MNVLNAGIDAKIKSIEVLNKLILDEKKVDVSMIFDHLLAEEKTYRP
jgi:hypothetical protein